jgi:hypothetical protein
MPGSLSPTELEGTWSAGSTTVTLAGCAVGEECGRLDRVDDNGEQCFYTLEYRSADAEGLSLVTSGGNSFGCGYSPWSGGVVRVTPGPEGTIEVVAVGVPQTAVTLTRVEG